VFKALQRLITGFTYFTGQLPDDKVVGGRGGSAMDEGLTPEEQHLLLKLARQALEDAVCNEPSKVLDLESLPPNLRKEGTTFVTLTRDGQLRGCIGGLEPYLPLAEDVRTHAVAAAFEDFRFPPLRPEELPEIKIEISRLTMPRVMDYDCQEDLLLRLRPGIDGVVLRDGRRQATFLPQVWEKIRDPELFLDQLCLKMGSPPNLWRLQRVQVFTYEVEKFEE
jgi:AmmeMemoRadiSam system protein A